MSKHILLVYQFFYPEQFRANDIAKELVRRGHKVTVLTGIPNYPKGDFFEGYGLTKKRRETWEGVDIIRIPLIPRGHNRLMLILNYLSFPVSGFFWNLITKLEADTVFTIDTSPINQCGIATRYAKKHKANCTMYVQDLWPENVIQVTGITNPVVIEPIVHMVERIYKGCTTILGTSPSMVNAIEQRCHNNQKVAYIPQYAEDFYKPVPKKPHEGFVITFAGNVGHAQGLEILPELAVRLKDTDVRFTIIGDGSARESLIKLIEEKEVSDKFTLIGRQPAERVPELLAEADVALIAYASDPIYDLYIPAKLQSYMACGMPLIALAAGETKRVIEEADCGYCVKPGDLDAAEKAIRELRDLSSEALQNLGQKALEYNEKNFSKEKLMDQLEAILTAE
ncbi:MAG: glycosyltransferase family 4 protein [Bacteroidaceae bacterium]|nr:glycosyltransferase family 4 protein [Bacteroidaceae bacterium]